MKDTNYVITVSGCGSNNDTEGYQNVDNPCGGSPYKYGKTTTMVRFSTVSDGRQHNYMIAGWGK